MGLRCSLRGSALLAAAVLTLAVAPSAHAGPGDLDVRFGTHGQTEVPAQVDSAALIPLADGRILVFGVPEDRAARNDGAIAVARLLANGEPDAAFAPGGHLDLRLGSDPLPVPTDALLLADGRVLVAGYFEGADPFWGPDDRRRSRAPGWLVRLSPDASIDTTFGVGGVARAGVFGVDRLALLFDSAIAAGAPGVLHRLDPNGAPVSFPGSAMSAVSVGSYAISAMASMQDGAVLTSGGFSGAWDSWELSRVSVSGAVVNYWGWYTLAPNFGEVASFARHGNDTRLMACGSNYETLVVQRWQSDGAPDPTFALATGGRVKLGVDARPGFSEWRSSRCRRILPSPAGDHIVVGDWSRAKELGGGRVVIAHLDASGAIDAAFDRTGNGRELALGTADQWSSWYVADADIASDGAVLLIARRTSKPYDSPYFMNELGEQHTLIARVEVSSSVGVGTIGFNDASARIAERQSGELRVYRSGGAWGQVSVRYELLHGTASQADIAPMSGTLTWVHGDSSPRTITLTPVDDAVLEGEESLRVRLSEATGGAGLEAPEIDVTFEDDEALRALQFTEPVLQIREAESANITIAPLAAAPGPIVVHYVIAPDLDPRDGTVRPTEHTYLAMPTRVGELRWSSGDTSSRTLQVRTFGDGNLRPEELIYVALADSAGTLRDGGDWKAARITVVQRPAPGPEAPPATAAAPTQGGGGGGAIALELLPLLALALLVRLRKSTKAISRVPLVVPA